jgi:hypothetical protein
MKRGTHHLSSRLRRHHGYFWLSVIGLVLFILLLVRLYRP